MKKQIVALILLLTLCVGLCAGSPCAAAKGSDLSYLIDENGVLTVSGTGTLTSAFIHKIPYEEYSHVTHIVVGEGITDIESYAFELFEVTLEGVSFPESLVSVGVNILGTKGAMDFTIYSKNPDALRTLLTQSNEDYEYFRYETAEDSAEAAAADGETPLL